MTHTLAKSSAGISTAMTRRNLARGSSRWTGVFRLENLNPSRVLSDRRLHLAKFVLQQYPGSMNIDNIPRQSIDRKSTRLNSSHVSISYAVFCLKKKKNISKR